MLAADAHLVPAHDAPEPWGREDEWLDRVRAIRRAELRQEVQPPAVDAYLIWFGSILVICVGMAISGGFVLVSQFAGTRK